MSSIAFHTSLLVDKNNKLAALPIEVDEHVLAAFRGNKDLGLVRDYFVQRAKDIVDIDRIFGFDPGGITKIKFCHEKCPGAEHLFTKNNDLWEKLRSKSSAPTPLPDFSAWICCEDSRCSCSWCVQVF